MIRKLTQEEYNNAADLSYQVCMECGSNDFTQEGIETFKSFVYNTSLMNTLDIYASLGFKKVGEKELNKGIVSIPMERNV
jgi:hypothetical protein